MNSFKHFTLILVLVLLASGCRKQARENQTYRARNDQKNQDRTDTATATCYFDFSSDVPIMNAKYYFISNSTEYFFDGEKSVNINHNLHHVVTDLSPNKFSLLRSFFITYSLHSMKNLMPALIDNPNAELIRSADTTINKIKCYNLEIRLKDRWVDMLDGRLMEAENQDPFYRLLIDKKSRFPVQFTLYNDKDEIARQSTFDNIEMDVKPKDLTWETQNLNDSYIEFTADEFQHRLDNSSKTSIDSNAPLFELSSLSGEIFSLKSSEKPALLVFWYPGCIGCDDFSDQLDQINRQYPSINIIWIDMSDKDRSEIQKVIDNQNRLSTLLVKGNKVSVQYGVISAPTYFIIDREGKIVDKGIYPIEKKPDDIGKYLTSVF